jgi:hypothetical protein
VIICSICVSGEVENFLEIDDEDHEDLHRVLAGCVLPTKFLAAFILFPADLPACSSALPADYGCACA